MIKYYRVKQDTFLWKKGAILKNSTNEGKGYLPIEDVWNIVEKNNEYISDTIIEDKANSEWFEKIYKVGLKGMVFRTKDQVVEKFNKAFKA